MAKRYIRERSVDEGSDAVFSDGENFDVLPLPSPGMEDPETPTDLALPGVIRKFIVVTFS